MEKLFDNAPLSIEPKNKKKIKQRKKVCHLLIGRTKQALAQVTTPPKKFHFLLTCPPAPLTAHGRRLPFVYRPDRKQSKVVSIILTFPHLFDRFVCLAHLQHQWGRGEEGWLPHSISTCAHWPFTKLLLLLLVIPFNMSSLVDICRFCLQANRHVMINGPHTK